MTDKEENERETRRTLRQKAWEENPEIEPGFSQFFAMTWLHKSDCDCSDCMRICKETQ